VSYLLLEDKELVFRITPILAVLAYLRGDFDHAELLFNGAHTKLSKTYHKPEFFYSCLGLIRVFIAKDDIEKAIRNMNNCKNTPPEFLPIRFVITMNILEGILQSRLGHFEEAESTLKSCMARSKEIGLSLQFAEATMKLGVVQMEHGICGKADTNLSKAGRLFVGLESPVRFAINLVNLGNLSVKRGNRDYAKVLFKHARWFFWLCGAGGRDRMVQETIEKLDDPNWMPRGLPCASGE
jgi:tetratricopeptide (TPR) repeat protein